MDDRRARGRRRVPPAARCRALPRRQAVPQISFNKFDLFWQFLAAELPDSDIGDEGVHPAKPAEKALGELGGLGFKTVRAFCAVPSAYFDPAKRSKYIEATDRMLDACDRHGIRLVFCLGVSDSYYQKATGEPYRDLIARPGSKSRGLFREFVRAMVTRYRDRKTIAMWEHDNELLLNADIGGKEGVWNQMVVPGLDEVARFHTETASFIHSLDPNHLVTTGDSYRYSQWHLYRFALGQEKAMWGRDTLDELARAVTMSQKGVDVFCVHYYDHGTKGANDVSGPTGKPAPCLPADWMRIAHTAGQPLYVGEFGVLPRARSQANQKFWDENPGWFTSFEGDPAKAAQVVSDALGVIVEARPDLTHWWCYASSRAMDQHDPQRMDISLTRTPALMKQVVEANRKLQMSTMGFTYMKPFPSK